MYQWTFCDTPIGQPVAQPGNYPDAIEGIVCLWGQTGGLKEDFVLGCLDTLLENPDLDHINDWFRNNGLPGMKVRRVR